jgi:two-component system nitrogen regulation response regulator NtrX
MIGQSSTGRLIKQTMALAELEKPIIGIRKVLVVEDEPEVLSALSVLFTSEGYAVATAENGEEAIKRMDDDPPDLVVADLFLPERDGFELLTHSLQKHPGCPVLAISGGGKSGDKKTFLEAAAHAGASATLEKPFTKAELLKIVDQLLQT